jgi:hypothetical protein
MMPVFYFVDGGNVLYCQIYIYDGMKSIAMARGVIGVDHLGIRPKDCTVVFTGENLSSWAEEVYT